MWSHSPLVYESEKFIKLSLKPHNLVLATANIIMNISTMLGTVPYALYILLDMKTLLGHTLIIVSFMCSVTKGHRTYITCPW